MLASLSRMKKLKHANGTSNSKVHFQANNIQTEINMNLNYFVVHKTPYDLVLPGPSFYFPISLHPILLKFRKLLEVLTCLKGSFHSLSHYNHKLRSIVTSLIYFLCHHFVKISSWPPHNFI